MTMPGIHVRRLGGGVAAAMILAALLTATPRAQTNLLNDPQLQEARQAYDATNYEIARDLLNAIIARRTTAAPDPSQRELLATAYELRGRTLQNLRDDEGARADFRFMLMLSPNYQFPPQAGARALALFEEVRQATVGFVEITVMPVDADVQVDDQPVLERPLRLTLAEGFHTIAATRRGHRSAGQRFSIRAGESTTMAITLEREFSTLTVTTAPANVEVIFDGVPRGQTSVDPEAAAPADPRAAAPSKPFVIEEVPIGRHQLEFKRDCFISEQRSVDIQRADDLRLELVRLAPAVASVSIRSDAPNATVFVDDAPRGAPPQVLNECHGPHVFEVRNRIGRHVRRYDLKPGQKEEFVANVRPAFAIVSDNDANRGVRGAEDLQLATENAFRDTRTLTLYVSPKTRTEELSKAERLPADWLTFDLLGAPQRGAATLGDPARRSLTQRFAREFESQGVAAIARDPAGDSQDMFLILLAPGSAKPDVLRWRLDNPASVRQVVSRLDAPPAVTRASLGMLAIDVLDIQGVVVASLEPGGGAAGSGIQTGDVVTSVAGKPVTTAAQLLALVGAQPGGAPVPLEVRDRTGAVRKVDVPVQMVPRLTELQDQTVLSNTFAVQLAGRALTSSSPLEEAAVRLNLAVTWMRLENWTAAARELDAIETLMTDATLPASVKESIVGSAQYLLGICAERTDDLAGAERAWTRAAQSPAALLTDSALPLKELSERRLADLRQARGVSR